MSTALIPLTKDGMEIVKAVEGKDFNELIAKQFFMVSPDGNIFIKKAGLQFKMNQKFGDKWGNNVTPIMGEEYEHLRKAENIPEKKPFQVFKATVFVEGREKPYIAYGYATEENCRNKQFLTMAETRALNRALRLATNCGFASIEEIEERETLQEVKERISLNSPPKEDTLKIKRMLSERMGKNKDFYDGNWKSENIKKFFQENIGKIHTDPTITVAEYSRLLEAMDEIENQKQQIQTDVFTEEDIAEEVYEAEFSV